MICTQAEVMAYLGVVAGGADEALIALVHPLTERQVKRFVGYNVEQRTHIDYQPVIANRMLGDALIDEWEGGPGWSLELLQLGHVPVREIVSVHENPYAWADVSMLPGGNWGPSYLLSAGAYWLDQDEPGISRTGHLYRHGGYWASTSRSVRVEYVAGYTPEELQDEASEFRLAVLMGVAKNFHEARAHQLQDGRAGVGPIQSESLAGWSTSYAVAAENLGLQTDLPVGVKKVLEGYVRMQIL